MAIPLSVVIITFNEAKNIGRCLDSVKTLSNDIIVVDSFSTDQTKAICESYDQVTFIQKKWEGYSKTKNEANKIAKHDMVLSIDADEAISDELNQSIQNITKQGVYEFSRLTNFCGQWIRHSGWYPDKKVRIFPKNLVYWSGDYVHETLVIPNDLTSSFLKGDLFHYSFYTEEEHLEQIEKFTTLGAQKLAAKGKKPSVIKLIFSPIVKFVQGYIFKLGFLDGYYGFVICKNSAYAKYLKYKKLANLK